MADRIQILIDAILKQSSEADLEKQLKNIEKKLPKLKLEADLDAQAQIKLHKSLQKIYKEEELQRLKQEQLSQKAMDQTEKQLQYEQKVRMALAQQKQKELETNKIIQQRIELFQKELSLKSQSLTGKYGSLIDSDALQKVNDEALKLTTESFSPEAKSRINQMFKEVEVGAKTSSKALKDGAQDAISFGDELGRSIRKFSEWYLISGLVAGSINAFKDGVSYIIDLDNSLNEIRIVTGKTTEEVTQLALSYNNLAKEMGVTTKEIASTSVDLYRQGLSASEVEDRMKAIIQYAKISSISLEDSNKIITATANATGESVTKIIDIFAMLGDSTSADASEIGEALQKVASAAENSGISIEKSASWIATISSITRESASTIGRSLKFEALVA